MIGEPSILAPTVMHLPHACSPSKQTKVKAAVPQGDSSDTDPEVPVAQQMLSFVMDDPDFESEEEHVQKEKKVTASKKKIPTTLNVTINE